MVKESTPSRKNKAAEAVIESVPEAEVAWTPRTALGKLIHEGTITDIDTVFEQGHNIMEAAVVNALVPDLEEDLLLIGQAKGKFGGGQRRIFRQTQKKTKEGNKIQFMTCALVGNKNGYVGVGIGKSKETVPAREKSKRQARLNLIQVRRGCGSWECNCSEPHSIPFKTEGKCASVKVILLPAPKGTGLVCGDNVKDVLRFAGIKDIWCKTFGSTGTKLNFISAVIDALKNISKVKISGEFKEKLEKR